MVSATAGGLIAAFTSVVTFGSFNVPLKSGPVKRANADPLVYQLYVSTAIFCTSWFALVEKPFVFTWYGVASATIWLPSAIMGIFAVHLVGISVAQAVWSGSTIVVSFLWGAFAFGDSIHSVPLAVLAIAVLLTGIAGVSASFSPADGPPARGAAGSPSTGPTDPAGDADRVRVKLLARVASDAEPDGGRPVRKWGSPPTRRSAVAGVGCALLLGVLNGSALVPLKLAPDRDRGLAFVPSQAIGIMVLTPVFAALYFWAKQQGWAARLGRWLDYPTTHDDHVAGGVADGHIGQPRALPPGYWRCMCLSVPPMHFAEVAPFAFVAGTLWTVGNVSSIVAADSPLGLTVGFPLTQCSLLVGGLWGVFVFDEISDRRRIAWFFVSSLVLIGGAGLLAVFG